MEDPTTSLNELSLRELTHRLATREPIPGGGSAAALAGAMGASLVSMVAELTIGRPDAADHHEELTRLRDAAVEARDRLLDLADEDSRAYAAVVEARRLPRETDEQRQARSQQLARAMVAAADAPLRAAQVAAEVVELARAIAPIGNPNAASDAGVAALLARAAVRGAILNVQINLPYLAADEPLRASAPAELERLARLAAAAEEEATVVVDRRIRPS
ncbi:MAG TPA: cyclodeaminase/cyclohydrolase family protein [Candidatus Limnocylindria bacterium]